MKLKLSSEVKSQGANFIHNAVKINQGVETTRHFVLQLHWRPVLVGLLDTFDQNTDYYLKK